MDETMLCAALTGQKKAYETLIRNGLDARDFSEAGRCIVESATEQYKRDDNQKAVDLVVLRNQVERRFGTGGMADTIMEFVATFPDDVSQINVVEEYRLIRLARVSTLLATALATRQHGEATESLLVKYDALVAGGTSEEHKDRLEVDDFSEDDEMRIPVYPQSLNDFIGGGVLPGHNITVYGRPESAKSLFVLNFAACALKEGYRVLYVANEEPAFDITKRLLSRMAQIDIDELRQHDALKYAFKETKDDYKRWHLLHKAGVTARDIRQHAARIKPDLIIVDQLKNLECGDDNRALQLDRVARQVREIGIEHSCVTISVTQAGESAESRLILKMTDVEWSNTGIPGAADLMIGIGVPHGHETQRMLSIPKNKANGKHGNFPVWINPQQTSVTSKATV